MTSKEDINQGNQSKGSKADDEIDLIELAKTIWDRRRTIIRFTFAGLIIGLIVAIASPKEYTASTVMVPQTGNSNAGKLGGLSSLAAMAGFNMNNLESTETLSPMVYPQIVNSIPFQLDLMNADYEVAKADHPVSLYTYYTEIEKPGFLGIIKKYTIGLPGVIIKSLKSKSENQQPITDNQTLIQLTDKQEEVRKKISEKLSLEINDKEGYLNLSANANDPKLAAQITQKAQQLLQQYITEFRVEKASEKLHFIEERYAEKKAEFEQSQKKLASFRDQNRNVSSAMAMTEEERLQSEYQLAYSVYSELAKQMEQAKIQVKEETPVFAIIQPVQVPVQKSKPNRPLILFIWIFLGGMIGTGIIFFRQILTPIKQRWNDKPGKD